MAIQNSYSSTLGTATVKTPLSPERLQEALNGYQLTQAVHAMAKLGLAEHLNPHTGNGKGRTCKELALDIGADEAVLTQFMKLLHTLGLVTNENNDHYQLTATGSMLGSDHPNSVLGLIMCTDFAYSGWGDLSYSIQTGKSAFDETFQMSLYEYLAQNEGANKNFNQWMEESTRDWILPALEIYDFSKFTLFTDIGGGTGRLACEILNRYINLQGRVFDQPHVVAGAPSVLESKGVGDRCEILSGNFFESIPTQSDLYIISRVLLNWDDDHALRILTNCHAAMDDSAKLLIIDFLLHDKEENASELLSSLHLQVLGGNLMRTIEAQCTLLSRAGFESIKLIRTGNGISIIEAGL
ncbi:MAG: methyltransferase [Deltaproteobacteria bacterium]|nr:methyltransferase [Deltaproteobacteria bacterium]